MACGAFPIVTEIPSNREWIVDKQNGFLVPIDDEGILARKIIEAIRRPERRIEVSDKNRNCPESAHWETISKAARIQALVESVTPEKLYITLEDLRYIKDVVHVKEVVKGLMKLRNQVGLIARASSSYESEVDRFYNLQRGTVLSLRFLGIKRQPYLISSLFLFLQIMLHLSQYDIIYARDFHTVMVAFLPRLILRKKLVFEMNGIQMKRN
jgi:hypothetical protein